MRILTWNIFGVNCFNSVKVLNPFNETKPRYPYIKQALEYYKPDVILFQEVIFPWDNSFVDSLENYHIINKKKIRSGGLAMATKIQPQDVKYVTFNNQSSLFNPKQYGDKFLKKGFQELDLGELVIINSHLACSYHPDDKADSTIESQAEQLLDYIRKKKNEKKNIILGGDLNFRKDSPLYDAFKNELTDLTSKLENSLRGYNKVDYIFGNMGATKSGYVFHACFKGSYPSDHLGIYVDLKL